MIIIALLIAVLGPPAPTPVPQLRDSFLDKRIGDATGRRGPLDDLTMRQLMRLSTLSPLRIEEVRCAGRALDKQTGVPRPAADKLISAASAALAVEARLTLDQAQRVTRQFGKERAWPDEESVCRPLWDAGTAGEPRLLPVIDPELVDPALVSCHGQYAAAATRSSGEEREGLLKNAGEFRAMALTGRTDAESARVAALLAESESALTRRGFGDGEDDLMKMVVCQPLRRAARQKEAEVEAEAEAEAEVEAE